EHREGGLGAGGAERDVGQPDGQRDDHAGPEPVSDLGVTLRDQVGCHHHARTEQQPRHDPDYHVRATAFGPWPHHNFPRRSSAATPITAASSTVTSTRVSRPRKSATMTVTTSPPCASGVSRISSAETLVCAGWDRNPHTETNTASPAITPASTSRIRRARRSGAARNRSGPSRGSRASAARNTSDNIVSITTATSATSGAPRRA